MKKYDGWIFKNKWGSLLLWTAGKTKKEVKHKISYWREWQAMGHKIVKFKILEVE